MAQTSAKRIHQWYSWILAAILTTVGVLLILSCLNIYSSGPRPYSAEAITLRFKCIAIPVSIAVAGIFGGIVLDLLLPTEKRRSKALSSPKETMLRFRKKANIQPVKKEHLLRLSLQIATGIFFAALMVYPAVYFLNCGQFTISNLNADVIRAVLIAIIPSVIGLALCWVCHILVNASYRREAAIYKRAIASGSCVAKADRNDQLCEKKTYCTVIKVSIILIALIFICIGIFNGGAEDVLKKAIAICTECIGLG